MSDWRMGRIDQGICVSSVSKRCPRWAIERGRGRPAVGKRRAGRKAGTGDPWTAGGQYNHKRMGVAGIADKGASWFVLRLGVRELATESGGCGSGMGSVIN